MPVRPPGLIISLVTLLGVSAASAAPEAPRIIVSADFEQAGADDVVAESHRAGAVLTTDPNEVVAGTRSLKGDSRAANGEWNEFFHSRTGFFQAREYYVVSFDYRVIARESAAKFYTLVRGSRTANNTGWKEWAGAPGERGHVESHLHIRAGDDTILIVGIRGKGAIAIDNLVIRTAPEDRPPDYKLPEPKRTWRSPGGTSYYVDSRAGSDAHDGKSPERAWQTLARVNEGEFAAGDRILLRAGSRWAGYLSPGGSGKEGAPILLDRYGDGPKPAVDAEGKFLATLYLLNAEYWEIANLDVANGGLPRQPGRCGVRIHLLNFGTAHHIHLKSLDVHDVTGSNVKADGGGAGIHVTRTDSDKTKKSLYDDLIIEGCRLARTDRNGITMSGPWTRDNWYPSVRVVIRNNLLEDIGGDGIVPIACDGALVERNVVRGGRRRCDDAAAGIWPWSCDNTVVQFNEVSGMRGTNDGQGYDSDWNCRNTLIQYNYSHDNEGGFLLVCDPADTVMPQNIGCAGTVARYNVSQNDGARTFHISGPCRDTQIYNNTIYLRKGIDIPIVLAGNWGGAWPENTRFLNNIFHVEGKGRFEFGGMRGNLFEGNVFFGNIAARPEDKAGLTTDPLLAAPGTGKDGFESLAGYRLRPGSPCLGAGVPVPENGGRDFWSRPVPAEGKPDVGACQVR